MVSDTKLNVYNPKVGGVAIGEVIEVKPTHCPNVSLPIEATEQPNTSVLRVEQFWNALFSRVTTASGIISVSILLHPLKDSVPMVVSELPKVMAFSEEQL